MLVGPDNGLLSLAWERCGGVDEAVDVTRSPHRLEPVSATFHGRDIFAPVARPPGRAAPSWPTPATRSTPASWRPELPQPREDGGALVAHALVIDRFGNVALDVDHERLAGGGITPGRARRGRGRRRGYLATYAQTFADVRPASCSSTRTPTARWRWPSTAATPPRTLGLRADAEVRLRPR